MIHIDVYVPAMDASFEFCCDEEAPLYQLGRDMYESLLYKSGFQPETAGQKLPDFWLCHVEGRRILNGQMSLREQGIGQGMSLMLL